LSPEVLKTSIKTVLLSLIVLFSSGERSYASLQRKAFVTDLLERIDRERMEQDLAHLVYRDPTKPYDNLPENLRTRFARRKECWNSAGLYIRDRLIQALGDSTSVEVKPFIHTSGDTMYNIIGTLKGEGDGYYIYAAHYDATAYNTPDWDWRTDPAPGADDNGSGVVSVLEAARVLSSSGLRFPFSIKFIFFSGEEFRMVGSKTYASEASQRGDNILGMINSDMIGYGGEADLIGDRRSQWLLDLMQRMNETYGIGLDLRKIIDPVANRGDHASFWDLDYDAVWFVEHYPPEDTNPQYDSIGDVVFSKDLNYHINFDLIAEVTRLVCATLAHFTAAVGALPDLAVYPGDVRFLGPTGDLSLTIRNLGDAPVESNFTVRVGECDRDSTAYNVIWEETVSEIVPPGGYRQVINGFWDRTVTGLFRIDVDPEDDIAEWDEDNNVVYQTLSRPRSDRPEITEAYVYPNPCYGERLYFHYQLSKEATVRIEVFNLAGEIVWDREILRDLRFQSDITYGANYGLNEPEWNCRNKGGAPVPGGLYIYKVSAFDGEGTSPADFVIGKFAVIR